jgi:hydroxymethylcytosylglucuronate/cytosylglucuronate synthase
MLGTSLGRSILGGLRVAAWHEDWPRDPGALAALLGNYQVDAGLVVLDPEAAIALERVGIATTYVDSLPYLWTPSDVIPNTVTNYCAQRCPQLPTLAREALDRVQNLLWVDGIIVRSDTQPCQGGAAVVNVGGLHSPGSDGNTAYLRLVLPAVLDVLHRSDFERIEVCGNIDVGASDRLRADRGGVGARGHADFLSLLDVAGIVITSPGLTTLLEASARNKPVVCLPPQNLSQILNARRFAKAITEGSVVDWPAHVLDMGAVDRASACGEDAALSVIYSAIGQAAEHPEPTVEDLTRRIDEALQYTHMERSWTGLADEAGVDGAAQIADVLMESLGLTRRLAGGPGMTWTGSTIDHQCL